MKPYKRRIIITDIQLYTAAASREEISAYMGYELIGTGRITAIKPLETNEEIADDFVFIDGVPYVRSACMFFRGLPNTTS